MYSYFFLTLLQIVQIPKKNDFQSGRVSIHITVCLYSIKWGLRLILNEGRLPAKCMRGDLNNICNSEADGYW